jgi:dGTPase
MLHYDALSPDLQKQIAENRRKGWVNPWRCRDESALRRDPLRDEPTLWRPAFIRDVEKVLHSPYYNRYTDKTQVFSFYRNDDITRRALHVQLVSRIARNIGSVLGLNLDLIEAIALGHDLGHTPFGHAGEDFLSQILIRETGKGFYHNVHGVRILDKLFCRNLTLQALDGVLCHNGEFVHDDYRPLYVEDYSFVNLDARLDACNRDESLHPLLVSNTLEGCVVRICDMVAYLGKDRQDARRARLFDGIAEPFSAERIGLENAEIINNVAVNLIENSYGKDHLRLDREIAEEMQRAKRENYDLIYQNEIVRSAYMDNIRPMFEAIFYKLLDDLVADRRESWVFRHHVHFVNNNRRHYVDVDDPANDYIHEDPHQIVTDYIASMTDDYFIDLYSNLFPEGKHAIRYVSYFDDSK